MYNSRLIKNCQYIAISLIISGFLSSSALGQQVPYTRPRPPAPANQEAGRIAAERVIELVNTAAARAERIMVEAVVSRNTKPISSDDLTAARETIHAIVEAGRTIAFAQITAACNNAINGINSCSTAAGAEAAIQQLVGIITSSFTAAIAAGTIELNDLRTGGEAYLVRQLAMRMLATQITEVNDRARLVRDIRNTVQGILDTNGPALANGRDWQNRLGPAFPMFESLSNWWNNTPNATTLAEGDPQYMLLSHMHNYLGYIGEELTIIGANLQSLIASIRTGTPQNASCIEIASTTIRGMFESIRTSIDAIESSLRSLRRTLADPRFIAAVDRYNADPRNRSNRINLSEYNTIVNQMINTDIANIRTSLSNAETLQSIEDALRQPVDMSKPFCNATATTPPTPTSTTPRPPASITPPTTTPPPNRPPRIIHPPAAPIPTSSRINWPLQDGSAYDIYEYPSSAAAENARTRRDPLYGGGRFIRRVPIVRPFRPLQALPSYDR